MTKIEKPWGYEIHWAETDNYVGKLLSYDSKTIIPENDKNNT